MAKRIFASSPWHLTADKDMAHRRLNVAQLTTLISHRTVRFSPHSGSAVARGAHARALARGFQITFAHTPAALCMAHSMCDVAHLRPSFLAQSVMRRAESCVDEAHYIDAHDAQKSERGL